MRIDRHARLAAGATLALMVLGSLVHGTGSSLACPDWPLCHGSFFPAMKGGVEFEHSHRLLAAAVVVLTGALLVRCLRSGDGRARRPMVVGAGLVALQAVLGGLTVIYRLPPAISIAHLATSMTFLCVLVVVSVRLAPVRHARDTSPRLRAGLAVAWLLVLSQIVLGGVVRHTGTALACDGVPLCAGEVWPDAWPGRVQMVHRAAALLVVVVVLIASAAALRRQRDAPGRAIAALPAAAALLQVALGVAVVLGYGRLDLVTVHHAGGAILLASLALNWELAAPSGGRQPVEAVGPGAPELADLG